MPSDNARYQAEVWLPPQLDRFAAKPIVCITRYSGTGMVADFKWTFSVRCQVFCAPRKGETPDWTQLAAGFRAWHSAGRNNPPTHHGVRDVGESIGRPWE